MGGRPFATLPGRPPTELTSIFTYSLSFTLVALDLTIGDKKQYSSYANFLIVDTEINKVCIAL